MRAYELVCKPDLRANESDDSREGSDEEEDGQEDIDESISAGNGRASKKNAAKKGKEAAGGEK